jgi:hypothetical protein
VPLLRLLQFPSEEAPVRVGYGKIGRVLEVNPSKWGESGGDNEPAALLLTLAERHPEVTWVVVGRNSGWVPPLPNIENPWQSWQKEVKFPKGKNPTVTDHVMRLDSVTMPTNPQISFVHYSSFLLRGINAWRRMDPIAREEVWLLPDPRNYIKGRDLKWPRRHPILCQFDWSRNEWCERYGDPRTPEECGFEAEFVEGKWRAPDVYVGSGLELVGIPEKEAYEPQVPWEEREHDFGILINENRNYGMRPEMTRLHIMQHYVKPLHPSWVNGTWSKASNDSLGLRIAPLEYWQIFPKLRHTKSTFTTPASGSRYATAKPWECFATGTICFFHPKYDTQGHIIPTLVNADDGEVGHLAKWLRAKDPDDLEKKVKAVSSSREVYDWLAGSQLHLLHRELNAQRCVTTIEKRLGL